MTESPTAARHPGRGRQEIYADHDDATLVVYQAYPPAIADAALAAGRFTGPFKRERMTWIKPSFTWMMYRCGYAAKPGQERVLAIRIRREGFAWALRNACLSHYDPDRHGGDRAAWRQALRQSPVRVQWDPERGLRGDPLGHRSIQIGLSGAAVARYVDEWTTTITDITPFVRDLRALVAAARLDEARALLPDERPYPAPSGSGGVC
ncbi:DUF4291 domain-containing protein [Nocardiopsis mangrovi]|uniref:DUF4291 domain-containing protein n=1 Tax=Nocardiopsis mangrovi TaxID=1179818 RepID=A0ABV9DRD3_9ACTN